MRKLETPTECKRCIEFMDKNPEKKEEYLEFINYIISSIPENLYVSRIKIATKIANNNATDFINLYDEYITTKSVIRKIEITKGDTGAQALKETLSKRPKPNKPFSVFDKNFWISKGFSEEESISRVSEIQKNNAKKRNKESYEGLSFKFKFSVNYWINKGYSLEEAELLRIPYVNECKNDLTSMINRYGEEEGTKRYLSKIQKYKDSMIKNIGSRGQYGYVSKESKKFFIPIYKFCRKLGIQKDEIYFGIKGSREFFIKDKTLDRNGGKFYDFCIPKLKIIIEYHGTFWHPRKKEEWRNFCDFQTAVDSDLYKENLAKSFGMEYIVVWSDEQLKKKQIEINQHIRGLYERSRTIAK